MHEQSICFTRPPFCLRVLVAPVQAARRQQLLHLLVLVAVGWRTSW